MLNFICNYYQHSQTEKIMISLAYFHLILSMADLPKLLGEFNALNSVLSDWRFFVGVGILIFPIIYIVNKNQVKAVQNLSEQTLQIKDKVLDQVQEQTTEMAAAAQEKINLILEEYQKFLPYAKELGLSIDSFTIEAGVLPLIKTSLRGSLDNIKNEVLERIKAKNNNNKLLLAVLNAILLAKKCNDKLESVYISLFKDIIIDIKLGIPPAISVRFQ